jgi:molecular chaperone DnaK
MGLIGIDLGTTYSAIGVVGRLGKPEIVSNREGDRLTPSVVLFQGEETMVGAQAKRTAPTAPDDVVQFVKRKMGDRTWKFVTSDDRQYSPEEISAVILKRLKEDAEISLGTPVTDAVITVPAYFDDARRKATIDAGVIAGLNVRRVLNEPTAAALAYGLDSQATGTVLVYDLGGGTFDVTIMKISAGNFQVLGTHGDRNLGGFDWDNELMKYVNEQVMEQGGQNLFDDDLRTADLRDKAELAKRSLTTMTETKVFISAGGRTLPIRVTRDIFDNLTKGLLGRTEDITELALDEAGLSWADIDKLLLVGGSTRMPMVQEMIRRVSGMEPERSINPDEVVALGAAIQAHLCAAEDGADLPVLAGSRNGHVTISDVAAHGLGILAIDQDTGILRNFVLIKHNATVPASGTDIFETLQDDQRVWKVQVTEGDDPDPDFVKVVGESSMSLPPYPKGAPLEVSMSFDIDGVIFAEIFDLTPDPKIKLGKMNIDRVSNLKAGEVDAARHYIQKLEIN